MTPFKLPGKRSKYGNKITVVDGRKFHSKAEAERYLILRDLEGKGKILDLNCQVPFEIWVNEELICTYIADFTYRESVPGGSILVVEDVKGRRTREFILKKKLMRAAKGIVVQEINVKSKWRKKRK